MHNQNFDIAFKQKAEGYSPTPSAQVWGAVQAEIGGAATLSKSAISGKMAGFAISTIAVISVAFLYIYSFSEDTTTVTKQNKAPIAKEIPLSSKENSVVSNTLEVTESYIPTNTKTISKPTIEEVPTSPVIAAKATIQKEEITINEVSEETIKPNLPQKTTNNDVSSEIEVIEVAEKIFEKDEFVTFRFDFQNTTGRDLNAVEIWEEFPEWCDINSIETTSSDNFHTVKTKIHGNYHEVVWKIKGHFSGDTSSDNNRGFIEYKVKLTEDRKASELNKNQPQIK